MKSINLILGAIAIITVLTFSNCANEQCGGYNSNHKIAELSMFQKPADEFYFDGPTKTLVLKKTEYEKSKPYKNSCAEIFFPMCDCYNTFDATYFLNDTLAFSEHVTIYVTDAHLSTEKSHVSFSYQIPPYSSFGYSLDNKSDSIKSFIEKNVRETIFIKGREFQDVLDLQMPDNPLINRVIIKQNVGLVAIYYQDELLVLRE